ncbi:MAG: decaprenyl-phosphate phosphoribosyltransferase [Armatimonadota bacterium]
MTTPSVEELLTVDEPSYLPQPPSALRDWVQVLRPRQWIKNLVVLAGLIFSAQFTHHHTLLVALAAVGIFCLLSSVGYLINDVLDAAVDRRHPIKCRRPIAAGRITPSAAVSVAILLACGGLLASWYLSHPFALVAAGYLALTLIYSLHWKREVILDLLTIAAGFVLRALAGTVVLGVETSPWLFVCVFLLALMLGLGKRRHELYLLEEEATNHRPVLADYGQPFLDQALGMNAAAAIVTYAVYAISSPTAKAHPWLVATVPLVLYGMLRYLYLVFQREGGGQPEELFLTDRPLYLTILFWVALVVGVFLYQ